MTSWLGPRGIQFIRAAATEDSSCPSPLGSTTPFSTRTPSKAHMMSHAKNETLMGVHEGRLQPPGFILWEKSRPLSPQCLPLLQFWDAFRLVPDRVRWEREPSGFAGMQTKPRYSFPRPSTKTPSEVCKDESRWRKQPAQQPQQSGGGQ